MNRELLNETIKIFDSPEKWKAFVELSNQKDNINIQWCANLRKELSKYYLHESNLDPKWDFKFNNDFEFNWFLKDYPDSHFASLWFEIKFNGRFSLFSSNNPKYVISLIKQQKFLPLLNCFEATIDSSVEDGYIIYEEDNFRFENQNDSDLDFDRLSWFAGNETDSFKNQIIDKVNKFINVTNLLEDINEELKNNKF